MNSCLRPLAPTTFTLKEKRSEFIAALFPVSAPEEARAALESVRKEHYSATHNCPAWRTGFPDTEEFSSDDGEPGGTAGRPILGALQKAELCNVVVVVTRYFGGVKLGVRGLIDAYSACAEGAVAAAKTERAMPFRSLLLRCGYTELNDVRHLIKTCGVPENRIAIEYGADVTVTLTVAPHLEAALRAKTESYEASQLLIAPPLWAERSVLAAVTDGEI